MGGYFQLVDYSAISQAPASQVAEQWTREHGIATIPLEPFYASPQADQHIVRLCFAKSDETLEQAAELLCKI